MIENPLEPKLAPDRPYLPIKNDNFNSAPISQEESGKQDPIPPPERRNEGRDDYR